jgi:MFS family permease
VAKFQGPNPATGLLVLTARNQNLVFSLPLVGAVLGGLLASPLNFYLGRKWPLIAAYILSIGGGLLQVFAPNLGAFVGGRSINGIAMGIAMATAPLYLSEVRYTEIYRYIIWIHEMLTSLNRSSQLQCEADPSAPSTSSTSQPE